MNSAIKNGFWALAAASVIAIAAYGLRDNAAISSGSQEGALTKADVEQIVKDVIRSNPELLLESLNSYQQKKYEEQMAESQKALKEHKEAIVGDEDSPIAGNPNGDVTVVEFFDYNCGYCKRALPSIRKLVEEDKNVKVVFKEFPILSPASVTMAQAALAVWRMDKTKYFDFHNALMAITGNKDEAGVLEIAKGMGLDTEKLKKGMESKEVANMLNKNKTLAQTLQIRGTPAFIIGDEMIPGAIDFEAMQAKVKEAREKGAKKE